MDTSETYIKMRLAAIPELGRGIDCPHSRLTDISGAGYSDGRIYSVSTDDVGNWFADMSDGRGNMVLCQLERQDQLQEMLQPCALAEVIQRFYEWYKDFEMRCSIKEYTTWSMEQLWLAFAMKEKFNKTWDGTNWISGVVE